MNKWIIVLIVGIIILVIGVGLLLYGSFSEAGQILQTENQLKSESLISLSPHEKLNISVPRGTVDLLFYQSSAPISINTTSTIVSANGIYTTELVATTSPAIFSFYNNNTAPVQMRYITMNALGSYTDEAAAGVLLTAIGFIVALVGGIVSLLRYLRSRRQG